MGVEEHELERERRRAEQDQEWADADNQQYEDMAAVGLEPGGAYHRASGFKPPTNIARLMREPALPPDMALEDWLVAGELHWLYADAEAGKTWLALVWARAVMEQGGRVVWFDEELGERVLTERMLALAPQDDAGRERFAEVVGERFAYFPFPSWQMTEEDSVAHELLLREAEPRLVVYDTATDALAEAGMDENKGIDVTRWVKAYPERARQVGAAQAVLDHVTKAAASGGLHAVGSRAKRAKAKVQYSMEMVSRFDRETVGAVRVRLTKNTRGAAIPSDRSFRVGGDGSDAFVWELQALDEKALKAATAGMEMARAIQEVVKRELSLTQRQLEALVLGQATKVREKAKEMAASGLWGFSVGTGARGSIVYTWDGPDDDALAPPAPDATA